MSSSLADLAGAGLSNVIPGHTLSPPTLADYAKAEREFYRKYAQLIADFIRPLPATVQEKIALRAAADMHDGSFSFGAAAFRSWALSATGLYVLVWLSLQTNHPHLSLDEATKLVNQYNSDGSLAKLVWDLWGYQAAGRCSSERLTMVDWGALFRWLTEPHKAGGLRMTHGEASALTLPQLLNLLGEPESRPLSRAEIAGKAAGAAEAIFDRIADQECLSPQQLAALQPTAVLELVRRHIGNAPIDAQQAIAKFKEYATRKGAK